MSMFNDILWGFEDNERECNANAGLVSIYARRFPAGRWSFLGHGSEKKWYSTYNTVEVGQCFAKRWKIIWPERLDSREHQNWVQPATCKGKYGVEIRIESVNKDNSHSWVRIYHGLNKLVTDLSNKEYDDNEQETSETKTEEVALKTNALAFASRSKAKAKPRRPTSAWSSARTVPICERIWIDVEPGTYSHIAYPVSKRLSTLLRHGHLPREEDGAIEFWRLQDYLRNEFMHSQHWSDEMWKSKMAGGGGNKKKFQYCTDPSGQEILDLRALQGHSGRNPIDPELQDNVLIPNDFFEYVYPASCTIHAWSMETTSRRSFLGRHQPCYWERI